MVLVNNKRTRQGQEKTVAQFWSRPTPCAVAPFTGGAANEIVATDLQFAGSAATIYGRRRQGACGDRFAIGLTPLEACRRGSLGSKLAGPGVRCGGPRSRLVVRPAASLRLSHLRHQP